MSLKQTLVPRDESVAPEVNEKTLAAAVKEEEEQPSSGRGPAIPKKRQLLLKWNGWGYKDSAFVFQDKCLVFTGDRYPLGNLVLPYFTSWVQNRLGGDFDDKSASVPEPLESQLPPPSVDAVFLARIESLGLSYSVEGGDRLFRAHGHTLHDIYGLRTGALPRLPDLVLWPESHDQVVDVVRAAVERGVVLIPYGGGTSVSGALSVPEEEKRSVVSLDMSQMNRILWVDEANLTCCAEAGIVGQDFEAQLRERGYTTGHEPDSYEFSSLGGWIATRASGMKKNTYGNIEDLLVHVKMVTPAGVVEKHCKVPRISAGPDIHHFILGSEGSLGVITEAVVKVRPLPPTKRYGSVVFPDFASGVSCMREVAKQRCQPSSIRLMDNEQFKFGHSLRSPGGWMSSLTSTAKQFYLTKFKGLDLDQICVATLLFEGQKNEVDLQEQRIYAIASKFSGLPGGDSNGERGYILTFVIAYIRDIALDYNIVAESFETSVPWSHTFNLCENVKLRVINECRARGIRHHFITCRVTQTYDVGACVYFYFAFNYTGLSADPVQLFEEIEGTARDEILANRGSISHHHGIGKIRAKWMPHTLSPSAIETLLQIKRGVDPDNIFGNGNMLSSPETMASMPPAQTRPQPFMHSKL